MDEVPSELLNAVREIRDLIRLMAEPAIAQRDKNLRAELRCIVGKSAHKAKSVLLMDGSRTQATIQKETGINQGSLSTFVKLLNESGLLVGEGKEPKLSIAIPADFFEAGKTDE